MRRLLLRVALVLAIGMGPMLSPAVARFPFHEPAATPSPTAPGALSHLQEVVTLAQTHYIYNVDLAKGLSAAIEAAYSAAGEHPLTEGARRHLSWTAFSQLFDALSTMHPDRIDSMRVEATRAFVDALGDPYSSYLNPEEKKTLEAQQTAHSFSGIGVEVAPGHHGLRVVASLEGSPARASGLRPGDEIEAVDGRNMVGLGLFRASESLVGPIDSVAHLVIWSADGGLLHMHVRRAALRIPPVQSRLLEYGEGLDPSLRGHFLVGYVRISIFGPNTPEETNEAIAEQQKKGATAFILDLRDNPGGVLQSALDVASRFAPGRILVRIIGRAGREEVRTAPRHIKSPHIPVVVLINGGTASSSEVVAGALQDYGVARLVGTRSYGKGLIQTLMPLADGGVLRLTTAHYRTPAGHDIQNFGLTPDVQANPDSDWILTRASLVLEKWTETTAR